MSEQPQSTPSDLPPIDTSKIQVKIIELEPPDYQFDIAVPVEITTEITSRIQSGGLQYDEKQMGTLIVQVCLDEAMQRLDKDSAWGARLLQKSVGKYITDEPFTFSAVVDSLPDDDFSLDTIPINRRQLQVKDSHVNSELFEQQLQFGNKSDFAGILEYGDEIECDAQCRIEGIEQPIASLQQCTLRIPSETQSFSFAGVPLPEIAGALRGCQTKDELVFPFNMNEKQGTLTLSNCSFSRITPATVEHVLEEYGTPNEALLRTQIRMSLQHNFDRENTNFMIHQLYSHLFQTVDLPISSRIVAKNYKDLCKKEMESTGVEELTNEKQDSIKASAEQMVKRLTLNAWLQRTFRLSLSEEDIDRQAAIIAEERRVRPSEIKEEFLAADKIQVLGNMASERKIFERLKDKMIFTDMV